MTDQETGTAVRSAKELRGHLNWLDTFTPLGLGVLAVASGIYTYLGVSSLLEDTGTMSVLAAIAYSVAVSVGIFVFWSYMLRLMPAMTQAASRIGLFMAMLVGSGAIIAMSSWLNAAALAGSAAVEQHLAGTVQDYQQALETAHSNAIAAQGLERDIARARTSFEALSEQEASGDLSGIGGQGAVYRLLRQKAEELRTLEVQIAAQSAAIEAGFENGNAILSRMRALISAPGAIEGRSIGFAEQSVRLAGVIAEMRQLSVAPFVQRAAEDLRASVVLPELADRDQIRQAQNATIASVLEALDTRAETLLAAAAEVQALPAPQETTYTPISTADAVIRYAGNFVPSWAGAIAIDLLPGVLVLILMVTHGAIRAAEGRLELEQTMTLADLQAALNAMRRIEGQMSATDSAMLERVERDNPPPTPLKPAGQRDAG